MFDFEKAQEYEMYWHKKWVDEYYVSIKKDIEKAKLYGIAIYHYLPMFFKDDVTLFDMFVVRMKHKNALEVSGGICGILPLWNNWIKGKKISIDPLLQQSHEYLISLGGSWFDGIELRSVCAEDLQEDLINTIDGFIMWRNGLDHMADPIKGIEAISSYAMKGCELYVWTDVNHDGEPDEGHKNLADTAEEVQAMFENNGWKLLYHSPKNRDDNGIEFGGVFVKL